jgi:hypothetical protein
MVGWDSPATTPGAPPDDEVRLLEEEAWGSGQQGGFAAKGSPRRGASSDTFRRALCWLLFVAIFLTGKEPRGTTAMYESKNRLAGVCLSNKQCAFAPQAWDWRPTSFIKRPPGRVMERPRIPSTLG